jgi:hypothetical protein
MRIHTLYRWNTTGTQLTVLQGIFLDSLGHLCAQVSPLSPLKSIESYGYRKTVRFLFYFVYLCFKVGLLEGVGSLDHDNKLSQSALERSLHLQVIFLDYSEPPVPYINYLFFPKLLS